MRKNERGRKEGKGENREGEEKEKIGGKILICLKKLTVLTVNRTLFRGFPQT